MELLYWTGAVVIFAGVIAIFYFLIKHNNQKSSEVSSGDTNEVEPSAELKSPEETKAAEAHSDESTTEKESMSDDGSRGEKSLRDEVSPPRFG